LIFGLKLPALQHTHEPVMYLPGEWRIKEIF